MPWVPCMEGIFHSDVHKGEAASFATARASTLLYSWPWWMEIQDPVGGLGGSRVNFRCLDFQAHQFEAQNRGWQHQLP